jgi:hypothetical protein
MHIQPTLGLVCCALEYAATSAAVAAASVDLEDVGMIQALRRRSRRHMIASAALLHDFKSTTGALYLIMLREVRLTSTMCSHPQCHGHVSTDQSCWQLQLFPPLVVADGV